MSTARLTLAIVVGLAWGSRTLGDGGTVRLSRSLGDHEITILTAPTPCRVGPVEFTAIIRQKGKEVNVPVTLRAWPADHPRRIMTCVPAEGRPIPCLRGEFSESGTWIVEIACAGETATFPLTVAEPAPRWQSIWIWMALPAVPVIFFAIQQIAASRRRH